MGWPFCFSRVRLFDGECGSHVGVARHIANQGVRAGVQFDGARVDIALINNNQLKRSDLLVALGNDHGVAHGVVVDISERDVASRDRAVFFCVESEPRFGRDNECASWNRFYGLAGARPATCCENEGKAGGEGEYTLHETKFTAVTVVKRRLRRT